MTIPVFDAELSRLRHLAHDVSVAVEAYGSAEKSSDRAQILQSIARSSSRLSNAATCPADAFSDLTFRPLANACVRVAISIRLFERLPLKGSYSIEDLARFTEAEVGLVDRVVRTLLAFDILEQDAEGRCSHTPLSLMYTDTSSRAWATWMHDVMISASGDIGSYYESHAFNSPTDAKDSPFTWARKQTGADIFEIVKGSGKLQLFLDAMSGSSVICAKEAVATYDFGRLSTGEDDVVLVDVGGNKGQTLKEIKDAYPALRGRMIVQDLPMIVESGLIPDLEAEFHAYDFFKEIEPVKGAAAYLYQRIFHDWSDERCRQILRNLKPAMSSSSRLLICEVVVPDHRPHTRKVLRDMNMLLVGGMERSETQWQRLLAGEGFRIEEIYGLHNANNSIIEAMLA